MKLALAVAGCLFLAPCGVAATPPAGGFTPIEQIVLGGCNLAESVALVRVSALQLGPIEGGERQTASFEVVRVIKGHAQDVPKQRLYSYSVPPETDTFPTRLMSGAEYVIFSSRRDPWIESVLPSGYYSSVPLAQVVALAESACRQAKIHEAPPDNSSKPKPLLGPA